MDKAHYHTLNIELERVHSWLNANRLTLNVNKTKHMLFCKRRNNHTSELTYLRLNNKDIQSVTEFNFLGLYLNSKLNWDTHTGAFPGFGRGGQEIIYFRFGNLHVAKRHAAHGEAMRFVRGIRGHAPLRNFF